MSDKMIAREDAALNEGGADVKTEVVAAYHELLHKLKQNKRSHPNITLVDGEDGAVHEIFRDEDKAIEEDRKADAILQESPIDYTRNILNLKNSVLLALDEISQQYLAQQKRLREIDEAIEAKSRHITELHDIEVTIDTLAALHLAKREKEKQFDLEMTERRQQFENEIAQRRRELHQEEQKFIYQRDLAREKEQNRYEMNKRDLEQELSDLKQRTINELEEREARIERAEKLQERIDAFPEELRIATQKAKDATSKQLTIQFEYENQLAQKELQLHLQKIATLEAKIAMLERDITHFEQLKASFNHLMFNKVDA